MLAPLIELPGMDAGIGTGQQIQFIINDGCLYGRVVRDIFPTGSIRPSWSIRGKLVPAIVHRIEP